MHKYQMFSLDKILFFVGVVFAVLAFIFAMDQTVNTNLSTRGPSSPNIVAAAAVLGFGIASGLSFLGSAIAGKKQKEKIDET